MGLPVTAATAGFMSVVYALLCLSVGLTRASTRVLYGTSSRKELQYLVHWMRAQENMAEYLPLGLILIGLTENNGALSDKTLRLVAALFSLARVSHALQLRAPETLPAFMRAGGFLSTLAIFGFLGFVNVRDNLHLLNVV